MPIRRCFLLLLIISLFVVSSVGLYFRAGFITHLQAIINDLDFSSSYAWTMLILMQILIVISGLIPAAMLGVAAGAIYGIWVGFLLSAIGTVLGAIVAFLLSRSLLRPLIYFLLGVRKLYLLKFDQAIKKNAWKTVCLLRLSPILRFSVSSYALGLTSIDFFYYFLGSLAALPGLFIYVLLGSLSRKGILDNASSPAQLLIMGIGVVVTLILILHVRKIAKREQLLITGLIDD